MWLLGLSFSVHDSSGPELGILCKKSTVGGKPASPNGQREVNLIHTQTWIETHDFKAHIVATNSEKKVATSSVELGHQDQDTWI